MFKKLIDWFFKPSGFRISILLTFIILFAYMNGLEFFELLENRTFDLRFKSRGKIPPHPDIVIATIDEESVREIGRWPWDRSVIAQMIETLEEYGVRAISFDVVFSEPNRTPILATLEAIENEYILRKLNGQQPPPDDRFYKLIGSRKRKADTDLELAETLSRYDDIVLGYFFFIKPTSKPSTSNSFTPVGPSYLDPERFEEDLENIRPSAISTIFIRSRHPEHLPHQAMGINANIPLFSGSTKHFGYFNMDPDPEDGVVRWYPTVIQALDEYYPALGLETVSIYLDAYPSFTVNQFGISEIQLKSRSDHRILRRIPTDEHGRLLINYHGQKETFPHYGISDILRGKLSPEKFRNKIVLVGATATGIYDLRVTPVDQIYPGVEIHANVINNILTENYLIKPTWFRIFDVLLILAMGIILGAILPRLKALSGAIFTLALILIYMGLIRYMFIYRGVWLSMVYPILVMVFIYTVITIYRYMTEEREKKKIKNTFLHYVTPSVVNEVLRHPEKLKLGGEKKELTVLFSDIRGFTTISETLSPEALVHLLNEYLTPMTDIVFKYEGTLDKYMGDAIMAFFGAPITLRDHASRACLTALEMMEKLRELHLQWEKDGIPKLDIGIGINTGPMSIGNMGSKTRFDYTVMGDSVNLGSRLEGLTKLYRTNILLSQFTYQSIADSFTCRELDLVRVKGKKEPIRIYELVQQGKTDNGRGKVISTFEEGLKYYQEQNWERAIRQFQEVLGMAPQDGPAQLYIERCLQLKGQPPIEGWDGVFTATIK